MDELYIRGTVLKVEVLENLTNYTWTAFNGDKKYSISRTLDNNSTWYQWVMYQEVRLLVLLQFPYFVPNQNTLFEWYTISKTLQAIANSTDMSALQYLEDLFGRQDGRVIESLLFALGEI